MRTSLLLVSIAGGALLVAVHGGFQGGLVETADAAMVAAPERGSEKFRHDAARTAADGSVAAGDLMCNNDLDCEDGLECTIDFCNATGVCDMVLSQTGTPCGDLTDTTCNPADTCDGLGTCVVRVTNDGVPCSDGLFCNGAETCLDGVCTDRTDPCVDLEHCDENANRCLSCVGDGECTDNRQCTTDACILNTCVFTTIPGCIPCDMPEDCDDGNPCTDNLCIALITDLFGRCSNPPLVGPVPCPDEFFCDGEETCQGGQCIPGAAPCVGLEFCDEDNDRCADCLFDDDCDDDKPCTDDTCNPASGKCVFLPDDSNSCEEDGDLCIIDRCMDGECRTSNVDCGPGDACVSYVCNPLNGACDPVFEPVGTPCPDDLFCNGEERCDDTGVCVPGTPPCAAEQKCDEQNEECVGCLVDDDCDDADTCTSDECIDGACEYTEIPDCGSCDTSADCDDGNPCTRDVCDAAGFCTYMNKRLGKSCSNGFFCDGKETCDGNGNCVRGDPPCDPDEICVEGKGDKHDDDDDHGDDDDDRGDDDDGHHGDDDDDDGKDDHSWQKGSRDHDDDDDDGEDGDDDDDDGDDDGDDGDDDGDDGDDDDDDGDDDDGDDDDDDDTKDGRCVPCDRQLPRRKVLICHIPPGNPANAHSILIDDHAVDAHLAHGDTLGLCPGDCVQPAGLNHAWHKKYDSPGRNR
jgi:hypothetical protein